MSNCFLIAWCTVMRTVTVGTHRPSISGCFYESGSVRDENFYRKLPHRQSGNRRLDFPSQALARSLEPAAGGELKPYWEILSR